MSDFERELREARERQRREVELQRAAAEEGERQRVLDAQSRERQQEEEAQRKAQREYQQYVVPVKAMVDRLMNDLAGVTWGNDYGVSFQANTGGSASRLEPESALAIWEFGLDYWKLRKTDFFGRPVVKDRTPVFEDKRFRLGEKPYFKPTESASARREEYLVRLDISQGVPFFVIPARTSTEYGNSPTGLDKTSDVSEVGLRDLLKREFIRGPRKTTISDGGPLSGGPSLGYFREGG